MDELTQAEGQDWDKGQLSSGLTKDEKKLLSSSQSEDWDETAAFPVDNVMDGVTEAGLPLLPLLMDVSPIGGLLGHRQVDHRQTDTVRKTRSDRLFFSAPVRGPHSDQNIWLHAGNLCCHQVPVLLTGEVSCVQQLHVHTHTHELM